MPTTLRMLNNNLLIVIGTFAVCVYIVLQRSKARLPLPPGPRKWPLIGNLLDMPGGRAWLKYAEWSREYGSDIIHLSAAGTSILVLNSAELVNELMEKRSAIYSSRAQLTMLHELMGWKDAFSFAPTNPTWRAQRKIFMQALNPNNAALFHGKQLRATHELLWRLHKGPANLFHELHHWAAILIMDITYGIRGDAADPYIETAVEALDSMAIAGAPGAFLVDAVPLLRHMPEWTPGAGFKRQAREWNVLRQKMANRPFIAAKQQITSGSYTPSLVSNALEAVDKNQDLAEQEELIKGAAVTSYGGGSDTVVAAVSAFVLAILQHPEIQAKAQRQLDEVLGHGELPSFQDVQSLPYITALVKEVLRHNPVTPLAIPHLLSEDDTWDGYWLPKGSIVMANAWAILHDENTYPDPMPFNPDRFLRPDGKLDETVKDPATASFGFGRRLCPGRHIALSSIWISVASILACYVIRKEVDAAGREVAPGGEWYGGPTLFNRPLPFKCRFVPRSKAVEATIVSLENTV